MAQEVMHLAQQQWYEDAAGVRDDADRLRHLIGQHRRVEALRRAGRVVLVVDGEGSVELEGGLLTDSGTMFGSGGTGRTDSTGGRSNGTGPTEVAHPVLTLTNDGHELERIIVAQWLHAHPDRVRVLEVESADGISMPADRIPRLADLCGPSPASELSPPEFRTPARNRQIEAATRTCSAL
jgi:hypothetical protein